MDKQNLSLDEKLDLLRDRIRENKDSENDIKDLNKSIEIWSQGIDDGRLIEEYRNNEISKRITKLLVGICLTLNKQLINEDNEVKRLALKADKQRCEWLLAIYNRKPEVILNTIENEVNNAIEQLELK